MTYVQRLLSASLYSAVLLLALGVLSVGLTGCYTQLKVADTADDYREDDRKTAYADEYRREYRHEYRRSQKTHRGEATHQYNYYFYDRGWYSGVHDPFYDTWGFFHDPWAHPWHRSRLTFSFYFGAPHLYSWGYRPWYRSPWHHSRYRYGPGLYDPYYGGAYDGGPYYGSRRSDRNYTPRGSSIGRGVNDDGHRATDRSVTRSANATNPQARTGRIGRVRTGDRTTRIRGSERPDRSRTGRIGRRSRDRGDQTGVRRAPQRRPDRTPRTRPQRTERPDRSTRTRSGTRTEENSSGSRGGRGRTRGGSSDEDENGGNLRSDARLRPSPNGGRIGRSAAVRDLFRTTREALPSRIRVPDFDAVKARIERQRRERRSSRFEFRRRDRDRFDNSALTRSERSRQRRTVPTRSSASDQRAQSDRSRSSSRSSENDEGRSRNRGSGGR